MILIRKKTEYSPPKTTVSFTIQSIKSEKLKRGEVVYKYLIYKVPHEVTYVVQRAQLGIPDQSYQKMYL